MKKNSLPIIIWKIFLPLLPSLAMATVVDTTIIANGTPGPYRIGKFFVDTSTIKISRSDSGYIPPFTYLREINGILFSDPIDSGVKLHFHFETDYYGLPKVLSLFQKQYWDPSDTTLISKKDELKQELSSMLTKDNIVVSGYKSVGVSASTSGLLNIEQSLDITIGGEVRPGTEIKGHLNDQGSSLEGTTREISDFDMIYISLKDPLFNIVVGDQYIEWMKEGIITGKKKIKGISAEFTPKNSTYNVFGALAGGRFTVQTWKGTEGQGPYVFKGNGESGFITPVAGSIKISVNDKICEEGEDKDFTVDYDLGTFTFTPKILIKPEDIIRAEYEYKMFDYQKTITGSSINKSFLDSHLIINSIIWAEIDNKKAPLELVLTDRNIEILKSCGDNLPRDTSLLPVNPNDVLTRYASIPLYIKKDTLGITIFEHKEPDPNSPKLNEGFYEVHFSEAEDGCGDYIRMTSTKYPDYIYKYVGHCNGKYTPLNYLPSPQRTIVGEMRTTFNIPYLKTTINIVGIEKDKNLFSTKDDHDNLASSVKFSGLLGKKSFTEKSAWLGSNISYWSARFDREVLTAHQRRYEWNDTTVSSNIGENYTIEVSTGITPLSRLSSELRYGQLIKNRSITTDKISYSLNYQPLLWLNSEYIGNFFRHFEKITNGWGQTQKFTLHTNFTKSQLSLSYRDEWLKKAAYGSGLMEGIFRYDFLPLNITQEIIGTKYRRGSKNIFCATDTSRAFLWVNSFNFKPLSLWEIIGKSNYRIEKNTYNKGTSTILLLDMNNKFTSSKERFSLTQSYKTSSEKTSKFIQIPLYVGEGRGTHRWDSTRNEYVEDLKGSGSFIITQRDIFDSTKSSLMKKSSFSINWSLLPPQGKAPHLINDLSWDGTLLMEEHLDSKINSTLSCLPGYISLQSLYKNVIPSELYYSNLSYVQEIVWRPSFNPNLKGTLRVIPDYKKIRDYLESSITNDITLERRLDKLALSGSLRLFYLSHRDTLQNSNYGDYILRDISLQFIQRREFFKWFESSIKERIGLAQQNYIGNTKSKNLDSTLYFQITPEVQWFYKERGNISVNYTFSFVNINENHDYRIANGFSSGISHVINFNANVKIGKNFMLNGYYRGEYSISLVNKEKRRNDHVVSLEFQAFL